MNFSRLLLYQFANIDFTYIEETDTYHLMAAHICQFRQNKDAIAAYRRLLQILVRYYMQGQLYCLITISCKCFVGQGKNKLL